MRDSIWRSRMPLISTGRCFPRRRADWRRRGWRRGSNCAGKCTVAIRSKSRSSAGREVRAPGSGSRRCQPGRSSGIPGLRRNGDLLSRVGNQWGGGVGVLECGSNAVRSPQFPVVSQAELKAIYFFLCCNAARSAWPVLLVGSSCRARRASCSPSSGLPASARDSARL